MDSSIENALLIDAMEELGKDALVKAIVKASCESDAELIRQLAKERQRKARAAHARKPK